MQLAALALTAALQLIPAPVSTTQGEGTCERERIVVRMDRAAFREATSGLEEWQQEEAYRLCIETKRIVIEALTPQGEFRARKTLEQLHALAGWQLKGCIHVPVPLPCCTIYDYPRFRHRGLMIDESRSFKGLDFLKKQVDAMALLKMNILHLHLDDSAGWRIAVDSYPDLTAKTAWRIGRQYIEWERAKYRFTTADDPEGCGGFYSKEDLRELVAYAAERYVTVIPEIEMPGHSMEVGYAYPEVICQHPDGSTFRGSWDLCPGSEATFALLEAVLTETMDIFPSPLIHIGGDEATMKTWADCPKCRVRMEQEGLTEVRQLQGYLIRRIESFLRARGRRIIGWDEILETGVPKDAVIQSWRGTEGGIKAAAAGHDVIMSPNTHCYLNYYQDLIRKEPKAVGTLTSLHWCYAYEPVGEGMDPARVRGLQGNLWCEWIPTPEHAEYMLYPRLFAIAERGWSPREVRDYDSFRIRARVLLDLFRRQGYNGFDMDGESELARSPWNNFPDFEKHRNDENTD